VHYSVLHENEQLFASKYKLVLPSEDELRAAPEHERCIAWNDPAIGIDWPIDQQPSLSAKDQQGLALRDAETF
jgi:dTDP-4-dehydrorhamnose 3,5-epimerase-like enzyme